MSFSVAARPTKRTRTLPRSASRAVLAAAVGLGIFVGPTSIRRVFHVLAYGDALALAPLLVERIVMVAVLVVLLGRTTSWLAQALARRHRLPAESAAELAALGLIPLPLLAAPLLPGLWGDRSAEPFSFAMLFLFVSVAVLSALLVASAFAPRSASGLRRATAHALAIVAALLAIGLLRPYPIEPHWSIPDDEAPFWPGDAFLAAYALGFAALAAPFAAAATRARLGGRRATAWLGAGATALLATTLGMATVTALKREHDLAEMALRFPPGAEVWTEMSGRGALARVLAPDGLEWSLPAGAAVEIRAGFPLEAHTWAQRRERVELELTILRADADRSRLEERLVLLGGAVGDAPAPALLRLPEGDPGSDRRLRIRRVGSGGRLPVLLRVAEAPLS